jgi:hypothetical protein
MFLVISISCSNLSSAAQRFALAAARKKTAWEQRKLEAALREMLPADRASEARQSVRFVGQHLFRFHLTGKLITSGSVSNRPAWFFHHILHLSLCIRDSRVNFENTFSQHHP